MFYPARLRNINSIDPRPNHNCGTKKESVMLVFDEMGMFMYS